MSTFAKTAVLNRSTSFSSRSLSCFFRENVFWLNIVTFLVVIGLCVFYIFQVNSTIAKGYQIRELETTIHELTLANQDIELDAQRAQSLDNVSHAVKMLGLVNAEQPVYVKSSGPSYALAQ